MKRLLFVLLTVFYTAAHAQNAAPASTSDFQFKAVVGVLSSVIYRGALIWPQAIGMGGVAFEYKGIFSFDGHGTGFFYRDPMFEAKIGYKYANMGGKFSSSFQSRDLDFRNRRDPNQDVIGAFAYNYMRGGSIRISLEKEISIHQGFYSSISVTAPILPFTSVGIKTGYGDDKSNRFNYGIGAVGGAADVEPFLNVVLPFLPGQGVLITGYSQPWIVQQENRRASFVTEQDRPEYYYAFANWRF